MCAVVKDAVVIDILKTLMKIQSPRRTLPLDSKTSRVGK